MVVNENLIKFMTNRRSHPAKLMGKEGPSPDTLSKILTIAARVPDHGKLVPFRFIEYTPRWCNQIGEKILQRAQELAVEKGIPLDEAQIAIEKNRFLRSPCIVAVVFSPEQSQKIPQSEQRSCAAAAAMNMLIGANAYGHAANWITEWIAYDESLKAEFGLQTHETIIGFIHIGSADRPMPDRERPDLDSIHTQR